jgi:hypothetical protein
MMLPEIDNNVQVEKESAVSIHEFQNAKEKL